MNLKEYFAQASGTGFLASSSADGRVDIAVYSSPHVLEDGIVAFVMRERLTYENLKHNGYAAYAYIEKGAGYRGVRLFIRKNGEDHNEELIKKMSRRHLSEEEDAAKGPKHLVYFQVEKVLALIGGEELNLEG